MALIVALLALLVNITGSSTEQPCAASRAWPAFPAGILCPSVSKHTMPLFYNWEQANACCPRLPVPCGSAGSKVGLHCCLCCHRGHPKPGAKLVTASPRAHPKQGAEALHGKQKGKEKVVKYATLKIPLKLMRIWLLAMSRASAGPRHGLELQLNSYIFFPPSSSWVHLAVWNIREKNTAKQPNASQRHATSPALESQSSFQQ